MSSFDNVSDYSINEKIRRQWKKWYLEAIAELGDKKIEVSLLEDKVARLETGITTMEERLTRKERE